MMGLETLLKVQMGLLHPLVDVPHFQLQGGEGLLHGGHPSLNGSKGLHNLRIIDLRLRWRDGMRG
jgi:hypothetical protein